MSRLGRAAADRLHGRLQALDVAAVVGAPHVDHVAEAALELVPVVGDVGGEIGIAAVRLQQRPVDIVAELRSRGTASARGPPNPRSGCALRRRQAALVDKPFCAQPLDRRGDLLPPSAARCSERSEKNTSCATLSAARSSRICAIIMSIALSRTIGSHSRLRHGLERAAVLGRERDADRLEIIAGIEAFRNRADVLAQRLAVAQVSRAREHVDLRAGIVDVVLARDLVAGELQQVRERIAEHRAAAMPDMHRPGRVGRDVFDIDLLAAPRSLRP